MRSEFADSTPFAPCALWVVIGHVGPPPVADGVAKEGVGRLVHFAFANAWSGPAAVIVFFVISGICIHFPFASTRRIPAIGGYLARRYLRVGVPLVAAAAAAPALGVKLDLLHDSILWSLLAELIYYSIYPILLSIRRSGVSWKAMIFIAFVAAIAVAATQPAARNYPSFGSAGNWLLGLPCWLLGCEIAERVYERRLPVESSIWIWRIGVWSAGGLCSALRFHSPLGYPWTLNVFAFLAAYWLMLEIRRSERRAPWHWLEWAGKWSYSVYLVHLLASAVFALTAPSTLAGILRWFALMCFVYGFSFCFYLLIEKPGHLVARTAGRWLSPRKNPRVADLPSAMNPDGSAKN